MKTTIKNPLICYEWPQAFDAAREARRPIIAQVGHEIGKCFPSGRFELKRKVQSYFGRCLADSAETQEIIERLKAQGVPFDEILSQLRAAASAAEERLNDQSHAEGARRCASI